MCQWLGKNQHPCQQQQQPATIAEALELLHLWIESQNRRPDPSPAIGAVYDLGGGPKGADHTVNSGGITGLLAEERRKISNMSAQSNAGYMAAGGGKSQGGKPGGKGGKGNKGNKGGQGNRGKGGVPEGAMCVEPGCRGHHPDTVGCPGQLAKTDPRYRPEAGACRWKVYGRFFCGSNNHHVAHHRSQYMKDQKGGKGSKGSASAMHTHYDLNDEVCHPCAEIDGSMSAATYTPYPAEGSGWDSEYSGWTSEQWAGESWEQSQWGETPEGSGDPDSAPWDGDNVREQQIAAVFSRVQECEHTNASLQQRLSRYETTHTTTTASTVPPPPGIEPNRATCSGFPSRGYYY